MVILHQSSQAEMIQNQKKKIYTSHLKKGLKTHMTFIISTNSGIINYCRLINECLKTFSPSNHRQNFRTQFYPHRKHDLIFQPAAIASNFFTNTCKILNEVTFSLNKAPSTRYTLWRGYYSYMGIKNLTPRVRSLCKYTRKIDAYIILTSKRRLGPNIQLKTSKLAKSTKSMIRTTQTTETIYSREKTSGMPNWLFFYTGKEAKHLYILFFYDWCQQNHRFGHGFQISS